MSLKKRELKLIRKTIAVFFLEVRKLAFADAVMSAWQNFGGDEAETTVSTDRARVQSGQHFGF